MSACAWTVGVTTGQKAVPSAEVSVRAVHHLMELKKAAWRRGHVLGYMRGCNDAPDTTFIRSVVRKGYRHILDSDSRHDATREPMGQLSFSVLDVRLLPEVRVPVDGSL